MHIFICGPIHIGKSTIVKKVISNLITEFKIKIGGFVTHTGINDDRNIYISPFCGEKKYENSNMIAKRDILVPFSAPQVFDTLGVSLLQDSKKYADLICMDELGFLEKYSFEFQNAVIKRLDENIPVLGIIKDIPVAWYDKIINHPNTEIFRITLENRNTLTPLITDKLKTILIKRI